MQIISTFIWKFSSIDKRWNTGSTIVSVAKNNKFTDIFYIMLFVEDDLLKIL